MNSLLILVETSSLVGERRDERDILRLIPMTSRCRLYEHYLADECMEFLAETDLFPSDEIKYYVKCLTSNRNESQEIDDRDFILVYDNARVHVSEAMKEFIQKSKLRSIGIPTYWPVLDPCEKLINATKQHLKSIHESGK